ncbi:MAG: twin-arginine translocation signal domain-containing protein, partial [Planctomycetia bacterium]|nr:twin-arginine translocation signal domain-containing protein [Planctomycetia bacterium]
MPKPTHRATASTNKLSRRTFLQATAAATGATAFSA